MTDRLSVSLMMSIFAAIAYLSSVIVAREAVSPFDAKVAHGVIVVLQFLQVNIIQLFFKWANPDL